MAFRCAVQGSRRSWVTTWQNNVTLQGASAQLARALHMDFSICISYKNNLKIWSP